MGHGAWGMGTGKGKVQKKQTGQLLQSINPSINQSFSKLVHPQAPFIKLIR